MSFFEINKQLAAIEQEFQEKSQKLNEKRETWLKSQAEYSRAYSMAILETKAKDPKKSALETTATADSITYEKRLEMIVAESAYKSLVTELSSLKNRLDALREQAFNLRKEASI